VSQRVSKQAASKVSDKTRNHLQAGAFASCLTFTLDLQPCGSCRPCNLFLWHIFTSKLEKENRNKHEHAAAGDAEQWRSLTMLP